MKNSKLLGLPGLLILLTACTTPDTKVPEPKPDRVSFTTYVSESLGTTAYLGNPAFAAFQDGDGPWQKLTGQNGAFNFKPINPKGRYGVLIVCADRRYTYFYGQLIHATLGELPEFSRACLQPSPDAQTLSTVSGSVAGLGSNEGASVTLGSGPYTSGAVNSGTYKITGVPKGIYDLAAVKGVIPATGGSGTASSFISRVILAREVSVDGDTSFSFDFAKEGFPIFERTITAQGGGAFKGVFGSFLTKNGTQLILGAGNAATALYGVVPTDQQLASEQHLALAFTVDQQVNPTWFGYTYRWFKNPADINLTLPDSAPPVPTVTVAGAAQGKPTGNYSYPLFKLAWKQTPGVPVYSGFIRNSAPIYPRAWILTLTEGWLEAGKDATYTIPDFSQFSEWQEEWGRISYNPVSWEFGAVTSPQKAAIARMANPYMGAFYFAGIMGPPKADWDGIEGSGVFSRGLLDSP